MTDIPLPPLLADRGDCLHCRARMEDCHDPSRPNVCCSRCEHPKMYGSDWGLSRQIVRLIVYYSFLCPICGRELEFGDSRDMMYACYGSRKIEGRSPGDNHYAASRRSLSNFDDHSAHVILTLIWLLVESKQHADELVRRLLRMDDLLEHPRG